MTPTWSMVREEVRRADAVVLRGLECFVHQTAMSNPLCRGTGLFILEVRTGIKSEKVITSGELQNMCLRLSWKTGTR